MDGGGEEGLSGNESGEGRREGHGGRARVDIG